MKDYKLKRKTVERLYEFINLSKHLAIALDKRLKIYYNSRPKTEERHQKLLMKDR